MTKSNSGGTFQPMLQPAAQNTDINHLQIWNPAPVNNQYRTSPSSTIVSANMDLESQQGSVTVQNDEKSDHSMSAFVSHPSNHQNNLSNNHGSYFNDFLQNNHPSMSVNNQQHSTNSTTVSVSTGNGQGSVNDNNNSNPLGTSSVNIQQSKPRSRTVSFDHTIQGKSLVSPSTTTSAPPANNNTHGEDTFNESSGLSSSWYQHYKGSGSHPMSAASSVDGDGLHHNTNSHHQLFHHPAHHRWNTSTGARVCPESNALNGGNMPQSGTGLSQFIELPRVPSGFSKFGGNSSCSPSPRGSHSNFMARLQDYPDLFHYHFHHHDNQATEHITAIPVTTSAATMTTNAILDTDLAQLMAMHRDHRQQFASFLKTEIFQSHSVSDKRTVGPVARAKSHDGYDDHDADPDGDLSLLDHTHEEDMNLNSTSNSWISSMFPLSWLRSRISISEPSPIVDCPKEDVNSIQRIASQDNENTDHIQSNRKIHDDRQGGGDVHSDHGSVESETNHSHGTSSNNPNGSTSHHHRRRNSHPIAEDKKQCKSTPVCSFREYRQQEFSLTAMTVFHTVMSVFFVLICVVTILLGTNSVQEDSKTGTSRHHQQQTNHYRYPLSVFLVLAGVFGWMIIASHAWLRKEQLHEQQDADVVAKPTSPLDIIADNKQPIDEENGTTGQINATPIETPNLVGTEPLVVKTSPPIGENVNSKPSNILIRYIIPTWLIYGEAVWIANMLFCVLMYVSYLAFQSKEVSSSDIVITDDDNHIIETPLYTAEHRIAEGMMILSLLFPCISYLAIRSLTIRFTLVLWMISVIYNMIILMVYNLFRSWPVFMLFLAFSLFLLLESYRQTWYGYIVTTKMQCLLVENAIIAESMKSNEVKHSIGNIAHDLKTPLSGFVTGLEVMLSMAKELKASLHVAPLSTKQNIAVASSPHGNVNPTMFDASGGVSSDKLGYLRIGPDVDMSTNADNSSGSSPSAMALQDANDKVDSILHVIHQLSNSHSFMMMTINRSIDYQKTMHGLKLIPKPEAVSLQQILSFPLECLKATSSNNVMDRIEVEIAPMELQQSWIWTDKQWLQDNLLCLLDNAMKYSNPSNTASHSYQAHSSKHGHNHHHQQHRHNHRSSAANNGIHTNRIGFNYNQKTVLFRVTLVSLDELIVDMAEPSNSPKWKAGSQCASVPLPYPPNVTSVTTNIEDPGIIPMLSSASHSHSKDAIFDATAKSTPRGHEALHQSSSSSFSSISASKDKEMLLDAKPPSAQLLRQGSKGLSGIATAVPAIPGPAAQSPAIQGITRKSPMSALKTGTLADGGPCIHPQPQLPPKRELSDSSLQLHSAPKEGVFVPPLALDSPQLQPTPPVPRAGGSSIPMIKFEVINTGPPLNKPLGASSVACIFNEPSQASRVAGGTGLGLFTLANRVESLHGKYGVISPLPSIPSALRITDGTENATTNKVDIESESTPGPVANCSSENENSIGSCFWFALPLQLVEAPSALSNSTPRTNFNLANNNNYNDNKSPLSPSQLTMKLSEMLDSQNQQQYLHQQQKQQKKMLITQGMQNWEEVDNESEEGSLSRNRRGTNSSGMPSSKDEENNLHSPDSRKRSSGHPTSDCSPLTTSGDSSSTNSHSSNENVKNESSSSGSGGGGANSGETTGTSNSLDCSSSSGSCHPVVHQTHRNHPKLSSLAESSSDTGIKHAKSDTGSDNSTVVMPFSESVTGFSKATQLSVKTTQLEKEVDTTKQVSKQSSIQHDSVDKIGTIAANLLSANIATSVNLPPLPVSTSGSSTAASTPRGAPSPRTSSDPATIATTTVNQNGIAAVVSSVQVTASDKGKGTPRSTANVNNRVGVNSSPSVDASVAKSIPALQHPQPLPPSQSLPPRQPSGSKIGTDTNAAKGASLPVAKAATAPVGPSLTVLLVDDSTVILKMVSILLQRHGHKVFLAENGLEAVQFVQQVLTGIDPSSPSSTNTANSVNPTRHNSFAAPALSSQPSNSSGSNTSSNSVVPDHIDVILMDFQMPVMNGIDAIHQIRVMEKDLPLLPSWDHQLKIIGFSAKSDPDEIAMAYNAGMNAFLAKPFMINNFYEIYQSL